MQPGHHLVDVADRLREGRAHAGDRGGLVEASENPVGGLVNDDDLAITDRLEKQTVQVVKFVFENRRAAGQATSSSYRFRLAVVSHERFSSADRASAVLASMNKQPSRTRKIKGGDRYSTFVQLSSPNVMTF